MGAWNYGVFDDDTAYDALTDLKNLDKYHIDSTILAQTSTQPEKD